MVLYWSQRGEYSSESFAYRVERKIASASKLMGVCSGYRVWPLVDHLVVYQSKYGYHLCQSYHTQASSPQNLASLASPEWYS